MKVLSSSSLSVYTKVLAHNLNDIRNWASLIGLLLRICWCLLSVFLIYCSDEWKKLVNLIYCLQVLLRMNFKIMYFLMKILGNIPSAVSAASRDSLSSQNTTRGIVFVSSFYWWHIEYNGWMCERLLNLQEIYVSGQNICIEVYGNSVGTITPNSQTDVWLAWLKQWATAITNTNLQHIYPWVNFNCDVTELRLFLDLLIQVFPQEFGSCFILVHLHCVLSKPSITLSSDCRLRKIINGTCDKYYIKRLKECFKIANPQSP